MKKLLPVWLLLAIFYSFAQNDSNQPPYLRFPGFPPVKLVQADKKEFSKDDLDKKAPVMLMLFSPDCDHCQHETEELIKHIDQFKKIQIVMATTQPFDSMVAFRQKYQLAKYNNIIVGHDNKYFLPVFFNIRSLPYLAFYNRKKELISVFEGTMSMEKALAELKK